ncbi:Methyl-CpG-binding domain protein 2 [Asimina triloba]
MKERDHFSYSGAQTYSLGSAQEELSTLDRTPLKQSGSALNRGPQESETAASQDQHYQDSEISGNSQNQLVVYNASDNGEVVPAPNLDEYESGPLATLAAPVSSKVLPAIGAFAVQCATCFKWRLIPTKEKYEEIRENILQEPFTCETAQEWRPDISCGVPADIYQDGSRLWAIDKPNISQPPPGWERLLRIRGEGGTRFADVYYVAPSGKRLRSMVEIEKYLCAHPEYIQAGVTMSQFSFQIPKPLQENYVRKRPSTKLPRLGNGIAPETSRPFEPSEASSLSWASPVENSNQLHIGDRQGESPSPLSESQVFDRFSPPMKKTKLF